MSSAPIKTGSADAAYLHATTTFVPPPHECVRPLLADLIDFANRDDLPAIAQAALAHAQLETIHPFGDGNGRAGRCLIHVVLRRRKLTPVLVPPISVALATNARGYIAGLSTTARGAMTTGSATSPTRSASPATQPCGSTPRSLRCSTSSSSGPARHVRIRSLARSCSPCLRSQSSAPRPSATRHGVTPTAARAALNRLEQASVLSLTRVGRRRDPRVGQRRAVPPPRRLRARPRRHGWRLFGSSPPAGHSPASWCGVSATCEYRS